MSAPTLKALIGKATAGPWTVTEIFRDVTSERGPIARLDDCTPNDMAQRLANAQLIARANPATLLAVYEALERITDQLERVGDSRKDAPFIEAARHALNLLNATES